MLLAAGADAKKKAKNSLTALQQAKAWKRTKCVAILEAWSYDQVS